MYEIVLDTETTGLEPGEGHRIVEIGAVELFNHMPTGRRFHRYLNPDRPMPAEALAVHGLTDVFLADKPRFEEVVAEFLDFLGRDSRLVIHNAAFDIKFLNAELQRLGHPAIAPGRALDTLAIARRRFPGAPVSLDALCRRFGIDTSMRSRHGALLDSEILADVYLELIGGRQPDLALAAAAAADAPRETGAAAWRPPPRPVPLAPRQTPEEAAAHREFVEALGPASVWRSLGY